MKKFVWTGLILLTVFLIAAFAKEYPFSLPRALLDVELGPSRIMPLTSDARKLIGRKGPSEQQLTSFLANRGWKRKETHGSELTYEKSGVLLQVHARFRRGYWWYELDTPPE